MLLSSNICLDIPKASYFFAINVLLSSCFYISEVPTFLLHFHMKSLESLSLYWLILEGPFFM